MSVNDHREISEWLRSEYGVRPRLRQGGKHPYLVFDYLGEPRRVTIPGTPSDRRYIYNLKSEMKRKLGQPLMPEVRAKRNLAEMIDELRYNNFVQPVEEMMADTNAPIQALSPDQMIESVDQIIETPDQIEFVDEAVSAVQSKIVGTVAFYKSNSTLNFTFPGTILPLVDRTVNYGIIRHDDGSWEIFPGKGKARFRKHSNNWLMTFGAFSAGGGMTFGVSMAGQYFGRTACEYIVVDGHIIASLTEPLRPVAVPGRPAPITVELPRLEPEPEQEEPQTRWVDIEQAALGDKKILRILLNYLVRTEAQTDWRLIKVNGGWRLRRDEIVPD
jgi:hypothetical protein